MEPGKKGILLFDEVTCGIFIIAVVVACKQYSRNNMKWTWAMNKQFPHNHKQMLFPR